ncbi:MAG: cyanophycinase [Cytophagaceae bacterium]|nr:cyanophycinase [Cytophagaceae bacterium]
MQLAFGLVTLGGFLLWQSLACSKPKHPTSVPSPPKAPRYTSWILGDTADVPTTTQSGLLLAGGSTDQDDAMRWFLQRANGGDVLIIRASGADGYNKYLFSDLGEKVNSVETILIDSRAVANNPDVARKIRNAEALFIAGGDQANYVNFWKDTPVMDALNFLLNEKRVTVGGTSAGCGILSGLYFDALNGTVDSPETLANPYNPKVSLQRGNFLKAPFLGNALADMHFSERSRPGRLVGFLARATKDWGLTNLRGIGVDEKTAFVVDETGAAQVLGQGSVLLLETLAPPNRCETGKPLDWLGTDGKALRASLLGPGETWSLKTWAGNAKIEKWSVEKGKLFRLPW